MHFHILIQTTFAIRLGSLIHHNPQGMDNQYIQQQDLKYRMSIYRTCSAVLSTETSLADQGWPRTTGHTKQGPYTLRAHTYYLHLYHILLQQ
ncbi:hypothetical protein DsansV1_C09g0095411 [Dioscorea sansibarensis]